MGTNQPVIKLRPTGSRYKENMDMYKEKFVVAIKHNGKVLREIGDVVKLPFGSEFSVLVKNLNSRRAKFTLHIDGTDVLDGTSIIVNANSEVEMKRFIRNGNMNEGNAYKFIERTKQIEDGPRGIKVDDGIVRVEFWFEKEKSSAQVIGPIYRHPTEWWGDHYKTYNSSDLYKGGAATASTARTHIRSKGIAKSANLNSENIGSITAQSASAEVNTTGITVPGSKIEQKFNTVYGFDAEYKSNVIILRLVGKTANDVDVVEPLTVKTKQKCEVCAHVNKSSSKFCSQCGASLELF